MDFFQSIEKNDISAVYLLLSNKYVYPNERNDNGLTPLHLCATYGFIEIAVLLLEYGADLTIKDIENGWTPLHRSIYFKHFKITWLFIKFGGKLDDYFDNKQSNKSINCKDHEGFSPLQLLSVILSNSKKNSSYRVQSNVFVFGKADYQLGVALPKAMSDVIYPKRIHSLGNESISAIYANKYHSICCTTDNYLYTWGHGRNGRLGHSNEVTLPEPERLHLKHPIIQVSAGLNHTLALTSTFDVLSWGSDAFGQLGLGSNDYKPILSPKRIETLRKEKVISISAGESHSICCTDQAYIYTWGSNRVGQLGLPNSEITHSHSGNPVSNIPKRVYLTTNRNKGSQNYKVIQVVASYSMSIALIGIKGSQCNEVCQWGNGISLPTKVKFPVNSNNEVNGVVICKSPGINIIQISGGKYHCVGVSDQGQVYTWGLGNEQLGHVNNNSTPIHYTSPRLVEALLPTSVGGKIIHVAASSNRTCAVTELGDLYTWGATDTQGILGHSSKSNYQPLPKRVNGIKRAKSVAIGDDHTLVLTNCLLPAYPLQKFYERIALVINDSDNDKESVDAPFDLGDEIDKSTIVINEDTIIEIPTLKQLCEHKLSLLADIKAIPYLYSLSETYNATSLNQFCKEFIDLNLDAVLTHAKPNDLDVLIENYSLTNILRDIKSDYSTMTNLSIIQNEYACKLPNNMSPVSITKTNRDINNTPVKIDDNVDANKDLDTSMGVNKVIKSIKKKLISIEELQNKICNNIGVKLTTEQKLKLDRKDNLLIELNKLELLYQRLVSEEEIITEAKLRQTEIKDNIVNDDNKQITPEKHDDVNTNSNNNVSTYDVFSHVKSNTDTKSKKKSKKFISLDSYESMINCNQPEERKIPLSAVGMNGRTVLSPPLVETTVNNNEKASTSTSSPWKAVPIKLCLSRGNSNQNVNTDSNNNLSISVSNSPSITVKKTVSNETSSLSTSSSKNDGYSLLSFITPSKQIDISKTKVISTNNSPTSSIVNPNSNIMKSWSVNKSLNNNNQQKSLIDIQKEEEITRQKSSMTSYGNSDNPWYIERKPRALSIDEVMKAQELEKNEIVKLKIEKKKMEIEKKNEKMNRNINHNKKK